jgi:single-strand DNA-binding protein
MAGSLNKVCLLGNVGKDPEIRNLQSGSQLANLTLATEESWKDKASGEKKSRTEWHRIVIFNPGLVGVVEKYVKKGSKLYIEGQLQTRKWTDQSGAERYSTEIVLAQYGGQMILLNRVKPRNPRRDRSRNHKGTISMMKYRSKTYPADLEGDAACDPKEGDFSNANQRRRNGAMGAGRRGE